MMKSFNRKSMTLGVALLLIGFFTLACIFPLSSNPDTAANTPAPTSGQVISPTQSTPVDGNLPATTDDEPAQPDPLDRLLTLKSIRFSLTTIRSDNTRRSLDADIDSVGNMHLQYGYDGFKLDKLPDQFDSKIWPATAEVFVLDGKAYQPRQKDETWKTTPIAEKYIDNLSMQLHSFEGPALWLRILPEGSIIAAGDESVGGFDTKKYSVKGEVDQQKISGMIWIEPQSKSLVQADLTIPAALLGDPQKPQAGEMKIIFKAQKVNIPAIVLPDR